MVPALVDSADWADRHALKLAASAQTLDHRACVGHGIDLVVCVPCAGSCRLQESAPLSGSKLLLLLDQLRFELFDQLGYQRLKLRLTPAECRFVPNRFIAHAQIGQHQLKGIDSGVAVQGVTPWRGEVMTSASTPMAMQPVSLRVDGVMRSRRPQC